MTNYRERPGWVRRLNRFAPATGSARAIVPLDPSELIRIARESTGLEDFGGAQIIETFERRIRSIDEEADCTVVGRLLCRAESIRILQTRLRLEAAWKKTPDILEEKVERPIFVVGAPRTGTTILLELLALDPALRAPIAWEAHHPIPHGEVDGPQAALAVAESEQELWADIQEEFITVHELRSDLPCECVHFMALEPASGYWGMHYNTPSFDAWAAGRSDLVPRSYRTHRRFLQTLQHGAPRRPWLLKTPGHLATMPALFAEYPDAVIVHTHRDPRKFVGSAASTTAMLKWLRSDSVDLAVQGQIALQGFSYMLNEVHRLRTAGELPDAQFVDSHYLDLLADPAAALRKIYSQAGLDWPDNHDETVVAYLRDKPKGKFGKHEYALEEYSLTERAVDDAYAGYVEAYSVALET